MMEELGSLVFGHRPESTKSARPPAINALSSPRDIQESTSSPKARWLEISSSEDSSVFSGLSQGGRSNDMSGSEMDTTHDGSGESSGEENRDSFSASRDASSADDEDSGTGSDDDPSAFQDSAFQDSAFLDNDKEGSTIGGPSICSGYTDYDSLIECTQEVQSTKPQLKTKLKLVSEVQIMSTNNEGRIAAMLEEHETRMNKNLATVSEANQCCEQRDEVGEEIELGEEISRRIRSQEEASMESRDDVSKEPEDEDVQCDAQEPAFAELVNVLTESPDEVEVESVDGDSVESESCASDESESHASTNPENDSPTSGSDDRTPTDHVGDDQTDFEDQFESDDQDDSEDRSELEHKVSKEVHDCVSAAATDYRAPDKIVQATNAKQEGGTLTENKRTFSPRSHDLTSNENLSGNHQENVVFNTSENGTVSFEDDTLSAPNEETSIRTENEARDEPRHLVPDELENQGEHFFANDDDGNDEPSLYENIPPVGSDDLFSDGSDTYMAVGSVGQNASCSEAQAESIQTGSQESESQQDTYESMSEFGRTEEKHESDTECTEQDINATTAELQQMSLKEIERMMKEKDVAIEEARWQAARYAELGREQIASLKRQLEELKSQSGETVKAAVQEAFTISSELAKEQKDQEIHEIVSSVRQVYKDKIATLKSANEIRVKAAALDATNMTTQKFMETITVLTRKLETERAAALQAESKRRLSIRRVTEDSNQTVLKLTEERKSIVQILEVAREKLVEDHADVVEKVQGNQFLSESKYSEFDVDDASSTDAKLLLEILQCHGVLAESFGSRMTEAEARHKKQVAKVQKEQSTIYSRMKGQMEARHQEEVEQMKRHMQEANDRVARLEADLDTTGKEKKEQEVIYREAIENGRIEAERLRTEKKSQEDMYREALENYRNETTRLRAERAAQEEKNRESFENFRKEVDRLRTERESQEKYYAEALEVYRDEAERMRVEKETFDAIYRQALETFRSETERMRAEKKTQEEKHRKALDDCRAETNVIRAAVNSAALTMSSERKKLNEIGLANKVDLVELFETNSTSSGSTSTTGTSEGVCNSPAKPSTKLSIDSELPVLETLRPPPISTPQNWAEPEGEVKEGLPPSPRFRSVRSFFENSRALQTFSDGSADAAASGPATPRSPSTPRSRSSPRQVNETSSVQRCVPESQQKTNNTRDTSSTDSGTALGTPDLQRASSTDGGSEPSGHLTRTVKLRKSWLPDKKRMSPTDGNKGSSHESVAQDQSEASWKLRKPPLPSLVVGSVGKSLPPGQGVDGKKPPLSKAGNDKLQSTPPKQSTPIQLPRSEGKAGNDKVGNITPTKQLTPLQATHSDSDASPDAYLRHAKQQLHSPSSKTSRHQPESSPRSRPQSSTFLEVDKSKRVNPRMPDLSVTTSLASELSGDEIQGKRAQTEHSSPPVVLSELQSQDDSCQSSVSPFEPVQFSNSFPSLPTHGIQPPCNRAPIVLSRSGESPVVLSMDSMEENRPSVVVGQTIFRTASVSAFAPPKDTSQSSGGSSTSRSPPEMKIKLFKSTSFSGLAVSETNQTTTAAKTQPLASLSVEPNQNRSAHARIETAQSSSPSSDTARRASNFASIRTRRLAARRVS
jgi:uncharacterized protein YukE